MLKIIGDAGGNKPAKVERTKIVFGIIAKHGRISKKSFFEHFAKRIKSKHVKSKVHDISMNKTVGDEPVILVAAGNGRAIKYQIVNHLLVAEAQYRNNDGDDGDNECNGKLHAVKVRIAIGKTYEWWYFSFRKMVQARYTCSARISRTS